MREERYVSYELMSRSDERIGLKSGWFLTVIPYSVSMPMTFGIAMPSPRKTAPRSLGHPGGRWGGVRRPPIANGSVRDALGVPRFLYRYWPVLTTRSTLR